MKENAKSIAIHGNERLLDILSKELDQIPLKKIKNYLKYKMVEVNGKIVTNANHITHEGDIVKVYFTKKVMPTSELSIIYEDKDLIAIDKPYGLLSIGNSKEKENTAFRMVSDYIKSKNKNDKLFVVHRLDQGTSGVLLFAKNKKIKEILQKDWNSLVKKREYVAVCEGYTPKQGTIENYLKMNHFQIVHSTKDTENGYLAITHYKRLIKNNDMSLIIVDIETGRRNQIRVHMSESGYPIVGDKKYGAHTNPINRLALHASKLHIIDPRDGKILKLESSVPTAISTLVK